MSETEETPDAQGSEETPINSPEVEAAVESTGDGEVAAEMDAYVKQAGFATVECFVGHGIGRDMHEEPQVPNFVSKALRKNDIRLEPGVVLAVEPMVAMGTKDVRTLDDGWTVETRDRLPSAHFEHTIAMTPEGPEVLTLP